MDKLVESILKNELISATEIFEERMATIAEKKLYEAKRTVAIQMDEVEFSAYTKEKLAKGYRLLTPQERDLQGPGIKSKKPLLQKVKDRKKATAPVKKDKEKRPGVIQRNINTLMGREPGYKPEPKAPEQKGGRVGKAVRAGGKVAGGVIGTAARLVGDFAAGLEEQSRPKRRIVLKKKKTTTLIQGFEKDKYNRNTNNRKVED